MTKTFSKFREETGDYPISIITRHVKLTEGLKSHVMEKLTKIEKFTPHMIEVEVRLEVQKLEQSTQIAVKFSHFKIQTHASSQDLYVSIDKAIEKMIRKIAKWKTRIQDHHAKDVKMVDVSIEVFEKPIDTDEVNVEIMEENTRELTREFGFGEFVKTKKRALKSLTVQEAIMKMELSSDTFMVYRSEEDQKLKVIYRRRDENYGVIAPE